MRRSTFLFSHASYCTSSDVVDHMISVPSHEAVIGAWLGAWPMPLDLGETLAAKETDCDSHALCCELPLQRGSTMKLQDYMEMFMHVP
jgi:hypothetical protein